MSDGSIIRPTEHPNADAKRRSEGRRAARVISGWKDNAGYQIGNPAAFLTIMPRAVPPVAEYDNWLAGCRDKRGHTNATGSKMRRAVQMIRSGSGCSGAARAIGLSANSLAGWLERLPEELRP